MSCINCSCPNCYPLHLQNIEKEVDYLSTDGYIYRKNQHEKLEVWCSGGYWVETRNYDLHKELGDLLRFKKI